MPSSFTNLTLFGLTVLAVRPSAGSTVTALIAPPGAVVTSTVSGAPNSGSVVVVSDATGHAWAGLPGPRRPCRHRWRAASPASRAAPARMDNRFIVYLLRIWTGSLQSCHTVTKL